VVLGSILSTEEPKGSCSVIDGDGPLSEGAGGVGGELEARVDARLGGSHEGTWVRKSGLRDGVIFGAELERDGVALCHLDVRGVEGEGIVVTDQDEVRCTENRDDGREESNCSNRETHFERKW